MPSDLNEQALELYLNNPYEFIGIMRLDLMNPLNAIHGVAGVLSEMLNDPELNVAEIKLLNQMMLQKSEMLIRIFNEISEYEKIRRVRDLPKSPD